MITNPAGGEPLRFTPEQVLERVQRHGDLFAAALPGRAP